VAKTLVAKKSELYLVDKHLDAEDAILLGGWIHHQKEHLQSIDLSDNPYLVGRMDANGWDSWDKSPWHSFCRSLRSMEQLTKLNLCGVRLGPDALIMLGNNISHTPSLTDLDLSDNKLIRSFSKVRKQFIAALQLLISDPSHVSTLKIDLGKSLSSEAQTLSSEHLDVCLPRHGTDGEVEVLGVWAKRWKDTLVSVQVKMDSPTGISLSPRLLSPSSDQVAKDDANTVGWAQLFLSLQKTKVNKLSLINCGIGANLAEKVSTALTNNNSTIKKFITELDISQNSLGQKAGKEKLLELFNSTQIKALVIDLGNSTRLIDRTVRLDVANSRKLCLSGESVASTVLLSFQMRIIETGRAFSCPGKNLQDSDTSFLSKWITKISADSSVEGSTVLAMEAIELSDNPQMFGNVGQQDAGLMTQQSGASVTGVRRLFESLQNCSGLHTLVLANCGIGAHAAEQ